jgi:hypothetical protein
MTDRTGGCLCGAVRYTVRDAPDTFGACHCTMCQRISGGVNLSFNVPADRIAISGGEAVRSYRSSAWAERSFCGTCGANLWYRGTDPADAPQDYSVAFGSLDDKSGMRLAVEICVETRPDAYAFAGERPQKRSEEVLG